MSPLSSRFLRIPKPQTFLYTMSLSTGASLITLSLLLNKLSGFYGILALLTGFHLSPFQLSMYIYSICALILTAYLIPHIKSQSSPLHCIALAWFYVLDSVINAAYTSAFAVTWFLVLIQHNAGKDAGSKGPGAGTVDDTAGFTNPELNVSRVEIIATPQASNFGAGSGQDAVAAGIPADAPAGTNGNATNIVLSTESINSIGIIVMMWTIRLYFCVVMLAWARMVLRTHIAGAHARTPATTDHTFSDGTTTTTAEKDLLENPFAAEKPDGAGWPGKLGRFMVSLGRRYWLGAESDDTWMTSMGRKFENGRAGSTASSAGIVLGKIENNVERERRRRSGTGPPLPSVQASAVTSGDEEAGGLKVPMQTNV